MPVRRRCFLALGSNLGNRLGNLQDAVRQLRAGVEIDAVSPLYESAPVGPDGQPPYYNAVCAGLTDRDPTVLLQLAKSIEWALGRRPGPRWGPRPIDVDLVLVDGVTIDTPALTVPHPRLTERAFVLRPLAEIVPDLRLPGGGDSVAGAAGRLDESGLRRIAGPEWLNAVSVAPAGQRPTVPGDPGY